MQIRLTDPAKVRALFTKKKGWLTIDEIAAGVKMSTRTIRRALQKEKIRPHTARALAESLEVNVTDIVTFK